MTTETDAPGRRFRPSLWMSVSTVLCLAVLVGLGTWQLQRLAWKTELIHRIEMRVGEPPAPLPVAIDDPDAWDYKPVTVTGTLLNDRELFIGPRLAVGPDGLNRPGVHVLTPLVRVDGSIVLVDRGFVPTERRDPSTRADGQLTGPVTVTGIARRPGGRAWLQPDNDPAGNNWFWYDLPAMAMAAGVEGFGPVIVQAGPEPNPGGWPLGGRTIVRLPNNHLSYALTWYGLALTLVGVYVAASFRRPDRRSGPNSGEQNRR